MLLCKVINAWPFIMDMDCVIRGVGTGIYTVLIFPCHGLSG
jgi:hypothetical protein